MKGSKHSRWLSVCALAMLALSSPAAVSPDLVISQVYGGGGNTGAPFTNDFVELFNRGSAPASLSGMSIQYTSAAGTGNFGSERSGKGTGRIYTVTVSCTDASGNTASAGVTVSVSK